MLSRLPVLGPGDPGLTPAAKCRFDLEEVAEGNKQRSGFLRRPHRPTVLAESKLGTSREPYITTVIFTEGNFLPQYLVLLTSAAMEDIYELEQRKIREKAMAFA